MTKDVVARDGKSPEDVDVVARDVDYLGTTQKAGRRSLRRRRAGEGAGCETSPGGGVARRRGVAGGVACGAVTGAARG